MHNSATYFYHSHNCVGALNHNTSNFEEKEGQNLFSSYLLVHSCHKMQTFYVESLSVMSVLLSPIVCEIDCAKSFRYILSDTTISHILTGSDLEQWFVVGYFALGQPVLLNRN